MQKKQIAEYERKTRSQPNGINPKIETNQINNRTVSLVPRCLTKNPFTKSLIKSAEYKNIPKSSYPVKIVQIDSTKRIAY